MSTASPTTYPSAFTVRWRARDMTILDDDDVEQPIESGDATVTFSITDLDGAELSPGEGTAIDDDWYWDGDTPATTGQYYIVVTITSPANWKGRDRFNVQAF